MNEYVIMHHGTKGMKWGVHKYQNPDGTYTQAGLSRYFGSGAGARRAGVAKNLNAAAKKQQLAKAAAADKKAGRKTVQGVLRRQLAGTYEMNEKYYAKKEAKLAAKAEKKAAIKTAKKELKEAEKDLKTSEKLNRKAQKGIFASRENMARQEASNKKMYKAEAKVLEKQAALGKAKGGEKGEMRAYMKAMHKTGLSGSAYDVQSGGKATRTYDAMAAKKGRDYAQKIEKKVRNQKVAALVGGTAVMIGTQAVISYLVSQNRR